MSAPDDEIKEQIESALGGHSEEQLRKLAQEIVEGKVFTDRDLRRADQEGGTMLGMIFMPVLLMPNSAAYLADAGLLYEYWDQAGPRSVNGYPIFFSVRKIIKKDMPALEHYVKTFWEMKKELEKKFHEAPIPPTIPGSNPIT
jgi:hypothetical protein